jgi:hypothetical protein
VRPEGLGKFKNSPHRGYTQSVDGDQPVTKAATYTQDNTNTEYTQTLMI